MKKQFFRRCTAVMCSAVLLTGIAGYMPVYAESENLVTNSTFNVDTKGWLLWHSYSDYAALDSRLYLRNPDGQTEEITGDFIHAMNGSFGNSPDNITFMAIDSRADEWDIYIVENGKIVNLTQNSGYRNEDPKWSPDGKSIVFKRGRWDHSVNDFVYNLALLDVETREVIMLTDDLTEEAMPCFSSDGKTIYYAGYKDGIGSIYAMDTESGETTTIYSESGITAYYPIVYGDNLYFTKWYSSDNHCDQLMVWDGRTIQSLPFNSDKYDCSDICPIDGERMIFSSTMNGGYDLYCYNGTDITAIAELNTDKNELGADFYSYDEYIRNNTVRGDVNADESFNIADIVMLQKWILGAGDIIDWKAGDLLDDRVLDAYDLCIMRRELLL